MEMFVSIRTNSSFASEYYSLKRKEKKKSNLRRRPDGFVRNVQLWGDASAGWWSSPADALSLEVVARRTPPSTPIIGLYLDCHQKLSKCFSVNRISAGPTNKGD